MGACLSEHLRKRAVRRHHRAYEDNPEILQHQALFDQMLLSGPDSRFRVTVRVRVTVTATVTVTGLLRTPYVTLRSGLVTCRVQIEASLFSRGAVRLLYTHLLECPLLVSGASH